MELEQIIEIAKRRKQILEALRKALAENDQNLIVDYARKLCGVNDESN